MILSNPRAFQLEVSLVLLGYSLANTCVADDRIALPTKHRDYDRLARDRTSVIPAFPRYHNLTINWALFHAEHRHGIQRCNLYVLPAL